MSDQYAGSATGSDWAAGQSQMRRDETAGHGQSAAGQAMDMAAEKASQVSEKAGQVGEQATAAVDQGIDKAASGLDMAAGMIRERGEHMGEGGVQSSAVMVADKLDAASSYLRDKDSGQLIADLEELVRRKPAQSLLVAAGIGFLLSKWMR